jgi:O-methyltransferase/methyltransferase family protein
MADGTAPSALYLPMAPWPSRPLRRAACSLGNRDRKTGNRDRNGPISAITGFIASNALSGKNSLRSTRANHRTPADIMTTAIETTDKDFGQMTQMLTGFFVTQIAGAVATYSIADHLAEGPLTAKQLSKIEGIDPTAAFRLLRACASLGLVTFDGQMFGATPLLGTLRRNVPGSLHSLAIAWSAAGHWLSWGRFSDAVRAGESQTVPALGAKIWDYYAQKPAEGAAFTNAMHGFTSGIAQEVARLVDTSAAELAVDMGGASGTLVHSLMMANPQLHGIILDLPNVVPSATAAASALGLAKRSKALAGDFFTYVPEADIYLLKHILHDWNDREAVQILKGCREAMRPGGRVIVIEMLLGQIGDPGLAPLMDLNMMVMLTGRERTLTEYGALLRDAGLRLSKSTPIRSPMAVIEAVAA